MQKNSLRALLLRLGVVAGALLNLALYRGLISDPHALSSPSFRQALEVLALAIFATAVYLTTKHLAALRGEARSLQQRLAQTEKQLIEARHLQHSILRISQRLAEASTEAEVIEISLGLAQELLGAPGATFVPLDERAQPLAATTRGEMPFPTSEAWLEYLASPAIRQRCVACHNHEILTRACPLLEESFHSATGMYCLPLRRGEQEFGIFNLYLPQATALDSNTQTLLRTLMDETTIALENLRLRQRAMSTLRQLQAARQATDLQGVFAELLKNLQETMEADFALIVLWEEQIENSQTPAIYGQTPPEALHLIQSAAQRVRSSRSSLMLENDGGNGAASSRMRTLLALPLITPDNDETVCGALVLTHHRPRAFNQRQISMLQLIAAQVALVVHNVQRMAQREYQAVLDERIRLAREIHDGLAQTLGFLKLKTAQMRGYLERNDLSSLGQTIDTLYEVLTETYQDVRQAIDDLRVISAPSGLKGWLLQTVDEFQESSDLRVHLSGLNALPDLPPEIQAQVIRIVQEALNNVRKHAQARNVTISCQQVEGHLTIEISDDGIGFCVEDIPAPSKHGLRGMRERAELIGADLRVNSQPHQGTLISLRLLDYAHRPAGKN